MLRKNVGEYSTPGADKLLTFFLPNLEGGGAERAIVQLANGIASRGVMVDLVLGKAVGQYRAEVSSLVRVIDLSASGKFSTIVRLCRYIQRKNPAVLMSSMDLPNIQMIIAANLVGYKGRKVISQRAVIAAVYDAENWLTRVTYRLAVRLTYPLASAIVSNSFFAKAEILAIPFIDERHVYTIHNSVDADRVRLLSKVALEDDWIGATADPLIISVGSFSVLKDRVTLIKAFAIVKEEVDVRLVILGEGEERSKIERLVSDLGLNTSVYFPGFEPNPFKWMQQSAVIVSSSITEGCPNNLLEALSLGLSVVATDCPGDTATILDFGRWGRLVPVGDAKKMAAAILEALSDLNAPDGKSRAAQFSPKKVVDAYMDVLLFGVKTDGSEIGQVK